jgi:homogentisate 1,2-dioxygenase
MKKYISFPRSAGTASRQAHCDLPEGTFEREFGREGFFGPCTHLHHAHKPTGWIAWEGDLRPYAFDMNTIDTPTSSPWQAVPMFHNAACSVRFWLTQGAMDHLVTNADGDELLFVHEGQGDLFCDFGHIAFKAGDYITMPRGAKWRVRCYGIAKILLIESKTDGYRLPDKGLVGDHAIFDPALLDVPELNDAYRDQMDEREWKVVMRSRGKFTTVTFPFNPLDTLGWHGDNLPVRINWRDIRPLMSHRYHLPPSAHTTFLGNRFVVCTFAPRPAEMDPGALKVPFYHSNNDFDEIIFYHMGKFFSRDNIHPGMVSLHPMGFAHGPHPKAFKLAAEADKARQPNDPPKMLDEVAVMIDTRDAVEIAPDLKSLEWAGYPMSWKE